MSLKSMTFHESYGNLPTGLLRTYRRCNVSPADHDTILAAFGCVWSDTDIPWDAVTEFVAAHTSTGTLALPRYL